MSLKFGIHIKVKLTYSLYKIFLQSMNSRLLDKSEIFHRVLCDFLLWKNCDIRILKADVHLRNLVLKKSKTELHGIVDKYFMMKYLFVN